ncbi:hypothetical protein EZS27_003890 [termite gut metagenome]|uniref:Uncharacterized protein n=1 Tax=termite gut metagenome TaxID=433724 RepID=A0A5J4SRL2_9ZZZZ
MKQSESTKKIQPKSIRLGWESIGEQKPKKLSEISMNVIKVEQGMFCKQTNGKNLIIP